MFLDGYRFNKAFGAFCTAMLADEDESDTFESVLELLVHYLIRLHQGCATTHVQLLPVSKRYVVTVNEYWQREMPDGTPCHFPDGEMVLHPEQVITVSMKDWMIRLITEVEDEFVPSYMLEH